MSRASMADRARLALLALRRKMLHLCGRAAASRWRPRLPGRTERIVIAPQDLRTADPTRASEIYGGRFAFAGKIVTCDGLSPFSVVPPSDEWAALLHGFGWLRHLRAADSAITRANARALVDEWISLQGVSDPVGWRPEVVARRTIAWLTQATLILDDSDPRFYRRFLRNLGRQVRYLRWTATTTRDGVPRLQAYVALTYAALCMANQVKHLNRATSRLVAELDRQILPDGGHISRNPNALIDLLLDFLPLSQAFSARNVAPPPALLNAIDRMMPMLRFFRHADGAFGMFNGMGPTSPDLLATILAYDDAAGQPLASTPHSGYQRVELGESVLLMDTGTPPPFGVSADAHAGCLSFEFSARTQRIIVNCGLPAHGRDNWRQISRATSAHSTVTFNDTSSCQFLEGGTWRRVYGTPISSGPAHVDVARESRERGGVMLLASHDGYGRRFSIIHHRSVMLSGDGLRLDGEDAFLPAGHDLLPANVPDEFAVRFHLHPSIRATRAADGRSAVLVLPNKDVWSFDTHEDRLEVEDSVYLAGLDGPRRTVQLVVYGHARDVQRVNWTLSFTPPNASRRPPRNEQPAPPP
ncbi:heparinase II/III family protein [Xanthobacteraceae bacterium Astr-EGSB]|uniref:heparinase II/III family protein n=1 Tax=Astrobacterium formosum TaxID=3069710 RepID=UPI0027B2BE6E|nr:heparinase II/III family protein [Xanthobacteraceae bacterium Astr-EGSB]